MNIAKSVKVSAAMTGTTQQELARHLGVTGVWLSRIMRDNSPRHLGKMADFYGITVSEFVKRGEL